MRIDRGASPIIQRSEYTHQKASVGRAHCNGGGASLDTEATVGFATASRVGSGTVTLLTSPQGNADRPGGDARRTGAHSGNGPYSGGNAPTRNAASDAGSG